VLLLLGGAVRSGLHGPNPDFSRRDESGNLVARLDFRSVYAAVLGGWFNTDAGHILERNFRLVPIL